MLPFRISQIASLMTVFAVFSWAESTVSSETPTQNIEKTTPKKISDTSAKKVDPAQEVKNSAQKPSRIDGKSPQTQKPQDSVQVTIPPQQIPAARQLKNGMTIHTLTQGHGPKIEVGDKATVHYKGMLAKTTQVVDDSYQRNQPFSFILGSQSVIPGWNIGLEGMQAGEKRKLEVPAALGYGAKNLGIIPPNSDLIYEVELISFEKGEKPDTFPRHQSFQWTEKQPGLFEFVEKKGQDAAAVSGDKIEIHYTGWLPSGVEVHSSKRSGQKVTLQLGANEVIRGWEMGLIGVQVGEVRYLKLSPQMAFGATPQARIPPHSTVIYRIETHGIEKPVADLSKDVFPDLASIQWTQLPSGLEVATLKEGVGAQPQAGQTVSVHYTGWLENGTGFDSSRKRGQPFEFIVGGNQVIKGWDIALSQMKVGQKQILKIPAELGYGSRGAGSIPPGATLIFMVELLEVK